VGLTVAVLKTVNSPLYGLSRKAESVEQAVNLIGIKQLSGLVTAIALRTAMRGGSETLSNFYDLSSKRAYALARLAKQLKNVDPQQAQTFGLFCDVAIPLLIARFPTYLDTLALAHTEMERSFTEVEHANHHTDHALIGAIMAKSWGLPHNISLAIRLHHDYAIFLDPKVPRDIGAMVAMGLLAEVAIHRHSGLGLSAEWAKGGDYVAGALVLAPTDIEELLDQLVEDFTSGVD
jgi:HD-like signal output (HDOD) protein